MMQSSILVEATQSKEWTSILVAVITAVGGILAAGIIAYKKKRKEG